MDPNCGITNQFLRPSFLIKAVTGILAFATLIYMFVLDKCLYEYVWRKPVSNGNLAAVTTAFYILAVIVAIIIIVNFSCIEKIPVIGTNRLYQIFISAGFAALALLFALIFGIKNSSASFKNKICDDRNGTFTIYWEVEHAGDEQYKTWENHHQGVDRKKYFANRTDKAAANVLGLFITLAVLYGVVLFYFYQDDNSAGFTNINDPINSNNNTPSYN